MFDPDSECLAKYDVFCFHIFDYACLKVICHQICHFANFVFFLEFILRLRKSPRFLPYGGKITESLPFKVCDFQSAKNILTVP